MGLPSRAIPCETVGQRRTPRCCPMFYMDESSISEFSEKAFGNNSYGKLVSLENVAIWAMQSLLTEDKIIAAFFIGLYSMLGNHELQIIQRKSEIHRPLVSSDFFQCSSWSVNYNFLLRKHQKGDSYNIYRNI